MDQFVPKRMIKKGYSHDRMNGDPRPVHLYVIEGAGLFKVGLANDRHKRLKDIQAMCPVPVQLAAFRTVRADAAGDAEHYAHLTLAEFHSHGEWFRCTRDAARAAIFEASHKANAEARRRIPPAMIPLTEAEEEAAQRVEAELAEYRRKFLELNASEENNVVWYKIMALRAARKEARRARR